MRALFEAIQSRFTGSSLDTALGGRLAMGQGRQEWAMPFGVYFLVGNVADQLMEHCSIQFSLFDDAPSAGRICDAYAVLTALFDNCDLPGVGNPGNLGMERSFSQLIRDEGVWHYIVEYSLLIERK